MAEDTKIVLTEKERSTLEALAEHLRGATPSERRAEVAFNYASKIEAMLAARPSADKAEGEFVLMPRKVDYGMVERRFDTRDWEGEDYRSVQREYEKWTDLGTLYAPGTDPAIARLTERTEKAEAERDEARQIVRDTHWMARRYADGRMSYAVGMFNDAVKKAFDAGWLEWKNDEPGYASDGMFSAEWVSQANVIHDLRAALAQRDANIAKAVEALEGEPEYREQGMGCGLEDRNITDRYEAMAHGWGQAMERVYGENIAWALDALRASSATQADGGAIQPAKEAGR